MEAGSFRTGGKPVDTPLLGAHSDWWWFVYEMKMTNGMTKHKTTEGTGDFQFIDT